MSASVVTVRFTGPQVIPARGARWRCLCAELEETYPDCIWESQASDGSWYGVNGDYSRWQIIVRNGVAYTVWFGPEEAR